MTQPFFTVAIPTKNRPDRLANAIRSTIAQTFAEFEIIVCDNSDEAEAVHTSAVVNSFDDPRVRYVRTSGRLSMPDNWERAVLDARGEYVGILTDRSVLRRDALHIVHDEVRRTGARVVCFLPDQFGRDPAGSELRRRQCSLQRYELESAMLLQYFLNGHPKYSVKVIPKLMSAMCHREILDTVRSSALGRICPPVCPDFTSGFLMLGHCKWILLIDDSLFISCGLGNGSAFRKRGELAERFRRDLGMTWKELVDRMPSDACFSHALVLNDFMRLRSILPERFAPYQLNKVPYYLGCLADYNRAARMGADRTEDLDALIEGLSGEDPQLQHDVRSHQLYLSCVLVLPTVPLNPVADEQDAADDAPPSGAATFANVFDAMQWGEDHPRIPSDNNLMAMPTLDSMKRWESRPRSKRQAAGVPA